jgi:hypothetical protein
MNEKSVAILSPDEVFVLPAVDLDSTQAVF